MPAKAHATAEFLFPARRFGDDGDGGGCEEEGVRSEAPEKKTGAFVPPAVL